MTPTPDSAALRSALEPCPFCGGRGITHRGGLTSKWAVSCVNCDCKPRLCGFDNTEAEAIAAWNRRSLSQPLPAEREAGGEVAVTEADRKLVAMIVSWVHAPTIMSNEQIYEMAARHRVAPTQPVSEQGEGHHD